MCRFLRGLWPFFDLHLGSDGISEDLVSRAESPRCTWIWDFRDWGRVLEDIQTSKQQEHQSLPVVFLLFIHLLWSLEISINTIWCNILPLQEELTWKWMAWAMWMFLISVPLPTGGRHSLPS